jgi:hypothetical protein
MFSSLLAIAVTITAPVEDGTHLIYRGSLAAEKGDPRPARKTFELEVLVSNVTADGAKIYWSVREQGDGGAWPWPHRFGMADVNPTWQLRGSSSPAIIFADEQGSTVVPVALPMFAHEKPLAPGLRWRRDALTYEVSAPEKPSGGSNLDVNVHGRFGRVRTLAMQRGNPIVLSLDEYVIINRGERFTLEYRRAKSRQLSSDEAKLAVAGFEAMLDLRGKLNVAERAAEVKWTDKQLATLKEELTSVTKVASAIPSLSRIVEAAQHDAKRQEIRADSIVALRDNATGSQLGDFKLQALSGDPITQADLKGAVNVLHFWSYSDKPLKQPYGQVGYLDFLYRQSKTKPINVIGVAVPQGISNQQVLARMKVSARKLRSFMNLSYPIYIGEGELLANIGDPRTVGAKLPLFVVVGPDGKVLHYHAGFYDINPAQGLQELSAIVNKHLPKD